MTRRRGLPAVSRTAQDVWLHVTCGRHILVAGFGPGRGNQVALQISGQADFVDLVGNELRGAQNGGFVECPTHRSGHVLDPGRLRSEVDLKCRAGKVARVPISRVAVEASVQNG